METTFEKYIKGQTLVSMQMVDNLPIFYWDGSYTHVYGILITYGNDYKTLTRGYGNEVTSYTEMIVLNEGNVIVDTYNYEI